MDDSLKNNFFLISAGAIPAALIRLQIDDTFIVNIIGCFLLGFLNTLRLSKRYKLMLGFAFCGSITSFSGWSFELFQLVRKGLYKLFLFNSIGILLIGIVAVGLGHLFAKKIMN